MAPLASLALFTTLVGSIIAAPTTEVKIQPVNMTIPAGLNISYNGLGTWFDDYRNACKGLQYSFDEPIAAINKAQFGNGTAVCGKYVEVSPENNSTITRRFKVVDVCKNCTKGGLDFSRTALSELTDEDSVKINWRLVEGPITSNNTTTANTTVVAAASKPTSTRTSKKISASTSGQKFHGRMTWFSDTWGSCGKHFSQNDMIVAMNEHQMGKKIWGSESRCGQYVRVWNDKTSVVLRIADTCPKRYCNHGALDLSQAAFRRFAPMSKGVIYLNWEFVN
ncbi:hypothetical protein BGZ73_002516 [Actinomortierella ambigua]|nr:hypothetical protein BGZ73_002516 [Actinomortierella ambigua]